MKSKHTKAGRRYRHRRHHGDLSREAWEAYQGRLLWMKAQMRASSCPRIRAEAERIRTVAVAVGGGL